jgi:hypothetical protein
MKKFSWVLGILLVFVIVYSCSKSANTPEEVALSFYENCFDGDFEKALKYVNIPPELSQEEVDEGFEELKMYIGEFKERHGNLTAIVVEGMEEKSETKYYVRLNIQFEDGYKEDENLTLIYINGKWKID